MFPHILVIVLLTFPGHTPFVTVYCSGGSIFTSTAGVRPAGQGRASRSRCRGVLSAGGAPREGKGQPPRHSRSQHPHQAPAQPPLPCKSRPRGLLRLRHLPQATSLLPLPSAHMVPAGPAPGASDTCLTHPRSTLPARGCNEISLTVKPLSQRGRERPGSRPCAALRLPRGFQQGADRHVLVLETVT